MFLSRRNWLYGTALLLTAALATAATAAGGEAFVDELALYDKTQWRKSDGWANSWSKNDTGWVGRHIAIAGGRMTITLTNTGASGRRFASGEYQSRRFFGYGRFERSEEHTSELQSLMRISYAVFCLKKKKDT